MKRPAYELEMHKMIRHAFVIDPKVVKNPCGNSTNMEDMGILSDGILGEMKVTFMARHIN